MNKIILACTLLSLFTASCSKQDTSADTSNIVDAEIVSEIYIPEEEQTLAPDTTVTPEIPVPEEISKNEESATSLPYAKADTTVTDK